MSDLKDDPEKNLFCKQNQERWIFALIRVRIDMDKISEAPLRTLAFGLSDRNKVRSGVCA